MSEQANKIGLPWDEIHKIHPWLPECSDGWHQHANGGGWVHNDCTVSIDSVVSDHSVVTGGSVVTGSSWVTNRSIVTGSSRVTDRSIVTNRSRVDGSSRVTDRSRVDGSSVVRDGSRVDGNSVVDDGSRVDGGSCADRRIAELERAIVRWYDADSLPLTHSESFEAQESLEKIAREIKARKEAT